MFKAEFSFQGNITIILCKEDESIVEICNKFANKIQTDINKLGFLYSGNKINLEQNLSQIINQYDKERNCISIIVYDKESKSDKDNNNKSKLIKSDFPICRKCLKNANFEIINYIIKLSHCKEKHITNMNINEYEESQKLDLAQIKCYMCKTSKAETYNNIINICNECEKILCPLCSPKHDKTHNLINYDQKNYICKKHNELYNSYCCDCGLNICLQCQKLHLKHEQISFGEIFPDKDKLNKRLKEFRNEINIFNKDIDDIINKLNDVKRNFDIIYEIYDNMITKFEDKNRNFQVLKSLNNFLGNNFIQDFKNINQINTIDIKFKNIIEIYEKMNKKASIIDNDVNNLNESLKNEKQLYSFECINKDNLKLEMYEGMEYINLDIVIKNNGLLQWPKNKAKLKFNVQKSILGDNIDLEPQKPGEAKNYRNIIKELDLLPVGDYKAGLIFEVDGKKYGNEIDLNVVIKAHKNDEKIEDEAQMIKEFRDSFSLDNKTFTDEILLNALIKHNLNYSEAFSSLFE